MTLHGNIKRAVLRVLRRAGGFPIAQRLTAHGIRILCYHGISLGDEHRGLGKMFMRPALFQERMEWLAASQFRVLSLHDALASIEAGTVPKQSVVITFDDGWYGTYASALPLLERLGFPATLYVTTYYVENAIPVPNIAFAYLLARNSNKTLDLSLLAQGLGGRIDLSAPTQRESALSSLVAHVNALECAEDQLQLVRHVADMLGEDAEELFIDQRRCTLMTPEELRDAASRGLDLQLHTHRHRMPLDDSASLLRELQDNRVGLQEATDCANLRHFCYPSGIYEPKVWPTLREAEILSATTCKPGLNYSNSKPLELGRFLDSEDVHMIEYEAELIGALELMRVTRRWISASK